MAIIDRQTLKNWARAGAQARLNELQAEIAAIRRSFPDLTSTRGAVLPRKRTISAAGRRAIAAAQRRRWAAVKAAKAGLKKAQGMSTAARKAASERMKKYWSKRRASK